jgi:hypothetical protein
MKLPSLAILGAALIAIPGTGFAIQGTSSPYTDAIGDIDSGITTGDGTLDIVGMEVSNTLTDVIFKLTVNGNVSTTDWGKFMIGIATGKTDGTLTGNGYGRPINLSYDNDPFAAQIVGMNHWVGSWVDGSSQKPIGGSEFYTYNNVTSQWDANGQSWNGSNPYPWPYTVTAGAQSTVEWTFPLALFSLNVGDQFYFDAYSSGGGGGDSAIDSLANPNVSITSWGGPYTSYSTSAGGPGLNSYQVVPEPSTYLLSALGVLALYFFARRRKA